MKKGEKPVVLHRRPPVSKPESDDESKRTFSNLKLQKTKSSKKDLPENEQTASNSKLQKPVHSLKNTDKNLPDFHSSINAISYNSPDSPRVARCKTISNLPTSDGAYAANKLKGKSASVQINKYGPLPYKPRGPESFPARHIKVRNDPQKGASLGNSQTIVPDFKNCGTLGPSRVSVYDGIEDYENVFVTLDKSLELVRPTSDLQVACGDDHDDLEELQLTAPEANDDNEEEEEYDPEALLNAISDWKKGDESFDAARSRLRRPSLVIPVWDHDVTEQRRAEVEKKKEEEVEIKPREVKKEEERRDEESKEHEAEIWKDDHVAPVKRIIDMKLSDTVQGRLMGGVRRRNPVEVYIDKRNAAVEAQKRRKRSIAHEQRTVLPPPHRMSVGDDNPPDLTVMNRQESGKDHHHQEHERKKLSLTTLDLNELDEKLAKIPRHMLTLSLKKLYQARLRQHKVHTTEQLFAGNLLNRVLQEIEGIAEQRGVSKRDRMRCVVQATQDYFDKMPQDVVDRERERRREERERERTIRDMVAVSPSQMEVLASLMEGGAILALKAHFISELPDVSALRQSLVCLNLSFNNFETLPKELLLFEQLQFLKLRDNPLAKLPNDIHKLKNLRSLVVSFCCLTDLPSGLFMLNNLEFLDVSYNLLTFLSRDVENLSALRFLSLEGNELIGLPCTMLSMDLIRVRIKNNFMSRAFWPETCRPVPQQLYHICLTHIQRQSARPQQQQKQLKLDEKVHALLSYFTLCDCCGKPMYGPGLHMLRHRKRVWGLKQVPFVFRSCSASCHRKYAQTDDHKLALTIR